MSPLMTSREDRVAQKAAANAEIERLCSLPVPDLAAKILSAWASAKRPASSRPGHDVAEWLMADYLGRPIAAELFLAPAVEEAIQALELAGLLIRRFPATGGSAVDLTRLGWEALARGTVRRYLPERPPAFADGPADPALQDLPASVVALARTRKFGEAVQRHKDMTGADLRQAENIVKALTVLPVSAF